MIVVVTDGRTSLVNGPKRREASAIGHYVLPVNISVSGEGGAGKSIIELTENVAHVMGRDWFGSLPEPGPTIYISARKIAN